tara:strand:- start:68 stop:520 length:453 start_codon:yes stop_codon:yes gene_type:complete
MFIQCSECDYKYLVNSADLKPDGRMVECANCNHRWYQEHINEEKLLSSSVPKISKNVTESKAQNGKNNINESLYTEVKNLPSTVVNEKKVSLINTFLVIFLLAFLFFIFLSFRSYGTNIFILINFYINEFFFNLKLIINDIAKIVYQILN